MWDRVDDQWGGSEEISADVPSLSVWILKIIQIWDGGQKVALEIQKLVCGSRKMENSIESTGFYLKISQVYVFSSKKYLSPRVFFIF